MALLLKWILVLSLLATGAFFLLHGLGINVPLIKYQGLEASNVPAGILLLAAGVLLAVYWKVSVEKTYETTTRRREEAPTEPTETKETETTETTRVTITTKFEPPRE